MSFLDILKDLVGGIEGGLAAAIMGMDGLSIQEYRPGECDIEAIAIEYGKVIEEIKNASTILNLGNVEEVVIETAGVDVLLRIVTPEYYIAFAVNKKANMGKSRYLLRKAALRAGKELSA